MFMSLRELELAAGRAAVRLAGMGRLACAWACACAGERLVMLCRLRGSAGLSVLTIGSGWLIAHLIKLSALFTSIAFKLQFVN